MLPITALHSVNADVSVIMLCLTLAYAVLFCEETVMYISLSFRCVWIEGFTIQVAYIIRNSQMLHSSTACTPNPSWMDNNLFLNILNNLKWYQQICTAHKISSLVLVSSPSDVFTNIYLHFPFNILYISTYNRMCEKEFKCVSYLDLESS